MPVGGGGLLGGVASAVKQLLPRARVVAVELAEGPGLAPALAAGKPVPVTRPATLADGMTPPFVGALPLAIAREAVDEIVTVTEDEIREGMRAADDAGQALRRGIGGGGDGGADRGEDQAGAGHPRRRDRVGRERRPGSNRRAGRPSVP